MATEVNEDTSLDLTVNFFDADGVAAVPGSVAYRVDCETNGREVRDWTTFGGTLAETIILALDSQDNCILNQANETEIRKVNVMTPEAHYEFEYTVINLHYPISPVIIRGDDYNDTETRALKFTGGLGWAVLTGASILLEAISASVDTTLSKAGTVEVDTGRNKTVSVELTAAETLALEAASRPYKYKLTATLSSGRKVTLTSGTLSVVER